MPARPPTQTRRTVLQALLCAALVVLGVALAVWLRAPSHLVVDTGPGIKAAGPVTPEDSLLQVLELDGPLRLTSVGVLLATWGEPTNTTHDRITVSDGDGVVIGELDLPPGTVRDNTYAEVALDPALAVPGDGRISVAVTSSDGSRAASVTAWVTATRTAGELYSVPAAAAASPATAVAGAEPLGGALAVRVEGLGPRGMAAETALRIGGLLACLALAALVWWWARLRAWWSARRPAPVADAPARPWHARLDVPRVYLAVALVWGVVLVFLTPPLQAFDELSHYYHCWLVAQGSVVVPPSGHVRLPEGAEALTNAFPTGPLAFQLQKVSLASLEAGMSIPMGSSWVTAASTTSSYGPVGYLPQAIGIDLVRLVRGPPLAALYLGRLLNLLAAVALTYFGLRLLPFARLPVALVALFPMTMMEMASLSADAMLLGGSIFFTGLVVRATTRDLISRREMVALALSAVLLLTAKPGYALLSLLLLLLLPRQFPSRRAWALTLGASIAGSLLFTVGFMSLAPDTTEFRELFLGTQNAIDAQAQLRGILTDPPGFVGVLFTTVNEIGEFFLRQSVAAYAWGQRNIGDALLLVAAAGVAAVLAAAEKVEFRAWRRALTLCVALLTALAVSVGLYLTWSDLGAARIEGLQGRYFIPSFVLCFVALAGFPFGRRWLVPAIVAVVVAVLVVTNVFTLIVYYY